MLSNKLTRKLLSLFILTVLIVSCGNSDAVTEQTNENSTIVSQHGQLSINGTNLVDKNGETIALRGMSLFWSQWGGTYYNEETIKWLRDDWKCTVIRVAVGVENGGYLDNKYQEYQKATAVIDASSFITERKSSCARVTRKYAWGSRKRSFPRAPTCV